MKKLSIFIALLLPFISIGQIVERELVTSTILQLENASTPNQLPLRHNIYSENAINKKPIEGSQFMQEEWTDGILLLNDQNYTIKGRYDIFNDEMLLLAEGQQKAVFPQKIKAIALGDHIFVHKVYLEDDTSKSGYFELLEEGIMSLFIRRTTTTKNVQSHPVLPNISNDYKVATIEQCFYSEKDKPLQRLKKNKKSILKVLSKKKKAVERYIKKEKLKVKKTKDIMKIFEYYNTSSKNRI